jgi:hypothetical protein
MAGNVVCCTGSGIRNACRFANIMTSGENPGWCDQPADFEAQGIGSDDVASEMF